MKIVFLTGAGMSVESGLTTFRDAGGLWENYPVMEVASHDGWLRNPEKVNAFYNMLRMKYRDVKHAGDTGSSQPSKRNMTSPS